MTHQLRFTHHTWHDAGLLRQYIGSEFAPFFDYGISMERYARMLRLARRLAALAQLTLDQVMADLQADYDGVAHAA